MSRLLLTVGLVLYLFGCTAYRSTYHTESLAEMSAEDATRKLAEHLPSTARGSRMDGPIRFTKFVLPAMPPEAIDRKIEGDVTIELGVDESGNVTHVVVIQSPHPLLAEAVVSAARQWKLAPMTAGGKPTTFSVRQTYGFHARQ